MLVRLDHVDRFRAFPVAAHDAVLGERLQGAAHVGGGVET